MIDHSLYGYLTQSERSLNATVERVIDVVLLFHERGFVDFRDWTWKHGTIHEDSFTVCDFTILLYSRDEGYLRIRINRGDSTLLKATLVMDDCEYAYLNAVESVPAKASDLDPLMVLLKLHDPVA